MARIGRGLALCLALVVWSACAETPRATDAPQSSPSQSSPSQVVAAGRVEHDLSTDSGAVVEVRPEEWAQPLDRPGLPNLHRVDAGLYRGGQPTDAGFAELKRLGIKTVVNLRSFHSDRKRCRQNGLDYVSISVHAWHAETEDVIEFLRVIRDPARQPVYVHCHYGADRTGMMCAIERVILDGWERDAAIQEMTAGGYGFHAIWQNLIDYVEHVDFDDLREQLKRG